MELDRRIPIIEALRILEERQRTTDYLRREIQIGIDQLDRGKYEEFDDESLDAFFEQVKANGRKELEDRSQGR